jgi:large subunit ribosomal protein L24
MMQKKKMHKELIRSGKIRKGDRVLVIAGNSKGQTGTVLGFKENRVYVQGVNMCKKHVKRSEQNKKGGTIEVEASLHVSNVALCDENGQRLKVAVAVDASGDRALTYVDNGKDVVYRSLKKPKQ